MSYDDDEPGCYGQQVSKPGLKTVYVSAVAMVDMDGRVLIAQRPEGKSMAGLWEFPGGKVEAGETPRSHTSARTSRGAGCRYHGKLPGTFYFCIPFL